MENLLVKHGGYRGLKSFQIAQLVFDITIRFCDRFVGTKSRTHDQWCRPRVLAFKILQKAAKLLELQKN